MQKYTASKAMIPCDTSLRVPAVFAGQVASRWPQLPVLSAVPLMNIDPRIFCCHRRRPGHTGHTCPRLRERCCKWGRWQFLIKHTSSITTNEGATWWPSSNSLFPVFLQCHPPGGEIKFAVSVVN